VRLDEDAHAGLMRRPRQHALEEAGWPAGLSKRNEEQAA
jgi:hypothetical protein